jgi:hypothetical protein
MGEILLNLTKAKNWGGGRGRRRKEISRLFPIVPGGGGGGGAGAVGTTTTKFGMYYNFNLGYLQGRDCCRH